MFIRGKVRWGGGVGGHLRLMLENRSVAEVGSVDRGGVNEAERA